MKNAAVKRGGWSMWIGASPIPKDTTTAITPGAAPIAPAAAITPATTTVAPATSVAGVSKATTSSAWLPTPAAAIELQCSQNYLKRNRDVYGGFIQNKRHWRFGPSQALLWNVPELTDLFHKRGLEALKARIKEREAIK